MSADLAKENGGLDLFKVILAVCGAACILMGVLVFLENQKLEKVKSSYVRAERLVPEIRALSEAIRQLHDKEGATEIIPSVHDYIQKYIVKGTGLGADDFQFQDSEGPVDKRGFQDRMVQVNFGTGGRGVQRSLSRQNIFNMLFNLESQSPQYKVSRLSMMAEEVFGTGRSQEDPTLLSDSWIVRDLMVVHRRPAKPEAPPRRGGGS